MDLSPTELNSTQKPRRYNHKFQWLMWIHWVMAAFLILLYLTGICVANLEQFQSLKWLSPFIHQSFGNLFLLLLVIRIFILLQVFGSRYLKGLPKTDSKWLKTVALRTTLYFFMSIVPVSGFCLRNFMGVKTTFFGTEMPSLLEKNIYKIDLAKTTHFWSSYIFLAFIILHAFAHWKKIRASYRKIRTRVIGRLDTSKMVFPMNLTRLKRY